MKGRLDTAGITILAESPDQWPGYFTREVGNWGAIIQARGIRAP